MWLESPRVACQPVEATPAFEGGLACTFQLLQVFESMSVRDNLKTAAQEHIGSMGRRLFRRPTDSTTRSIG